MNWASTLVVLVAAGLGTAGTIRVPDDYQTIQGAIDAANDRDIIRVDIGVYGETIDFLGKEITVCSINPRDSVIVANTIIDASSGDGSVATFRSGESRRSVLSGFTLTGGSGEEVEGWGYGGGVYITSGATLESCVIKNNTLARFYSAVGGGVYVSGGGSASLRNCRLEDNGPARMGGGAIYCGEESRILVTDSVIRSNTEDDLTIWVNGAEATIRNTAMIDNGQYLGGAVLSVQEGRLDLVECRVAHSRWSGVTTSASEASNQDCVFERNGGSGLGMMDRSVATIERTEFKANTSGAVWARGVKRLSMEFCTIRGHRSSSALLMEHREWSLGDEYKPSALLRNCLIYDNAAISLPVMEVDSYELEVIQCSIFGNWSASGDAALSLLGSGSKRVQNSIIWGNEPSNVSSEFPESLSVSFSNIGGGWPGIGNIEGDPLLLGSSKRAGLLRPDSPCIDAGDPLTTDDLWDWHPRWPRQAPNGERADMGALGGAGNGMWASHWDQASRTSADPRATTSCTGDFESEPW